ncbi:hypothetical protein B5F07_04990 [Lachnoclostridium sp. An169]|nr:hypothetical protein B5F07_04990 [Lachnoclostridium sp. An169]
MRSEPYPGRKGDNYPLCSRIWLFLFPAFYNRTDPGSFCRFRVDKKCIIVYNYTNRRGRICRGQGKPDRSRRRANNQEVAAPCRTEKYF